MLVTRGYEDPVLMPSMGVYDTSLAKAYISGVREQYERGQQEAKDFLTKYQDFVTPISKDQDYWYKNTIGGAKDMIKQMQDAGIDPFRSPEARAAISNYIYSRPYDNLSKVKQSAETAKSFQKVKAELQSRGLWNPEYENYMLQGNTLDNWSTVDNNAIWQYMSPGEYKDLHSFTDEWFKHLKPTYKGRKGGFMWYGIDDNDLNKVIAGKIPDIINDGGLGQFYYQQALRDTGGDEDQARQLLKQRIASRNRDYTVMTPEVDQYALESIRHQHAMDQITQRSSSRSSSGNQNKEKLEVSQFGNLYQQGIAGIFGKSAGAMFSDPNQINYMKKNIYAQQQKNMKAFYNNETGQYDIAKFLAKQTVQGDPTMLKRGWERQLNNFVQGGPYNINEAASYYLNADDLKHIESKYSLFTQLAGQGKGWNVKESEKLRDKIKKFDNPVIENTAEYQTVLTKSGRVKVYNKARVYNTTRTGANKDSRQVIGDPIIVYLYAGIESEANGSRGQYLSNDGTNYDRTQPFEISRRSREKYDAANMKASLKFGNKPGDTTSDMYNVIPNEEYDIPFILGQYDNM